MATKLNMLQDILAMLARSLAVARSINALGLSAMLLQSFVAK